MADATHHVEQERTEVADERDDDEAVGDGAGGGEAEDAFIPEAMGLVSGKVGIQR